MGGDTGGGVSIRAPFTVKPSTYQPGLVLHNNAWKTTNQIAAEANAVPDRRPLTDKFPVSAGLQHKVSERQMQSNQEEKEEEKELEELQELQELEEGAWELGGWVGLALVVVCLESAR